MINIDELHIVNYCHPNCVPLLNIMRLPRDEAFALAYRMSAANEGKTAFGRFADFENYYPRRMKQDEYLYSAFTELGGCPKEKHPLSFVLQGSDYLNNWFDDGIITRLRLTDIPSDCISFTYGDSGAVFNRTGSLGILTKEMLIESIKAYTGTLGEYMQMIVKEHYYIEAQVWDDGCILNRGINKCYSR